MRTLALTGEYGAQFPRVRRRITAGEIARAAQVESVIRRTAHPAFHGARPHVEHGERPERRGFVPAFRAMNHEGALDRQPGQRLGHELRGGQIERAGELEKQLEEDRSKYLEAAQRLREQRVRAAKKFEQAVERGVKEVAMESARFEIRISDKFQFVDDSDDKLKLVGHNGLDRVEFYFSANPGEEVKPLSRVASGGEASRLMLVLKTVANAMEFPRTIVFDEIDTGIGGRVSEAVGVKLKRLSETNQVLCVTHQAQIARFADNHLVVEKEIGKSTTKVNVARLDKNRRVEEIARMLTGGEITDSARKHARELLRK